MKKMYVVMLMAMLVGGSVFAGCGSSNAQDAQSTNVDRTDDAGDANDADSGADAADDNSGIDIDSLLDNLANASQAQGRDYGETYELTQNDVMHSAFFDLKVNSVRTADELEEYVPVIWDDAQGDYVYDEDTVFLIVNVSITNTCGYVDPMFDTDFPVLWGDDEGCYPDCDFSTAFPEEYEIAVGQTVTGDLIYQVPRDIGSVTLEYYDLYEDEFEGNTFDMVINVN